jgi:hypothetical protein
MARRSGQHMDWARRGASVRLEELESERAEIFRSFPDLRSGRAVKPAGRAGVDALGRRRRTISAEGKKRMAEGMRKYWAKRKAGEKKEK